MFHDLLNIFAVKMLFLSVIFALCFAVERMIPAERSDAPGMILNWMVGFFTIVTEMAVSILIASLFVKFSWNFAIQDHGEIFRAIGLLIAWMALRDFLYYWFHRLQHASKWLWAEHALHHSDEHVNATTSVRHHWLEVPLGAVFVAAPLSYSLRPSLITVSLVSFTIGLVGVFIHMNARIGFGRFGWLLASPQNHRIHHSRLPEHTDKNFAQFFPLWDVLFGTYYRPKPDEYPPTGLASGQRVTTIKDSLLMPFVMWWKMFKSKQSAISR